MAVAAGSLVDEGLDLCDRARLPLDGWQREFVAGLLEQREDGRWAHFEGIAIVPRQNGKGNLLVARSLVGLYLDPDCRLIVHSAHEFSTALEAFRRLLDVIEDTPELLGQVERVSRAHGEEGIELLDGSRIRFKTRTKSGGRGLSADLLIFDEAMILPEAAFAALLPILSARPNAQVLLTGSAVDQVVHEHGVVLARARERGHAGAEGLLFVEFAADAELDDLLRDPSRLADRELWAQANAAYPHRITAETIERELAALDARSFAVERLGVGDWPVTEGKATGIIDLELWAALLDPDSEIVGPVRLALDVAPDSSRTAVVAAGRRRDGLLHVEVLAHREGTGWAAEYVAGVVRAQGIRAPVRLDPIGPVNALVPALNTLGVTVKAFKSGEYAQAAGILYNAIMERRMRHLGSLELNAAVAGASTRPLGDSWVWARKKATVDISPLVAATLAAWEDGSKPKRPIMVARG